MRKSEAVSFFKEEILPSIIESYGENDKVAIRTAWNDWTDSLCKDGRITPKQYNNWLGYDA
jgi:hypothetical protein